MAIPPLPANMRIQNDNGQVSADFARWWQLNVVATQAAQVSATTAISQAAAAQSQAETAAAAANSAGANKPSGSVVGSLFDCLDGTRVTVASIPLVGIVAGTLRFDTTSLYGIYPQTGMTGDPTLLGTFWITEQLTSGGAINDLYTDTFTATNGGAGEGVDVLIDDPAALSAARPTVGITGNVTYRLQVARASGTNTLTSARADFRAAQA